MLVWTSMCYFLLFLFIFLIWRIHMLGDEMFLDDPLDSSSSRRGKPQDVSLPSSFEPGSLTSILSIAEVSLACMLQMRLSISGGIEQSNKGRDLVDLLV